jgi:hypothetical protein
VPADSHVITADVMSGMGQGNSLSGARILTQALRTGPYGTTLPREDKGRGPPSPPHISASMLANESSGGATKRPQILAAGGEFIVPGDWWVARDPDDGKLYVHRGVKQIGGGDSQKGHDILDGMMKKVREFNINWLKHAPRPKKSGGGAIGEYRLAA